jgi:ABC-type Na+ efflux pump permease subunit
MNVLGRNLTRRPVFLIGILILVLLLGSVIALTIIRAQEKSKKNANYSICLDDEIGAEIKQSYKNFTSDQAKDMTSLASKIEQKEAYEASINCLVVLVRYYGYVSRYADAIRSYDTLKTLYENTDRWADPSITSDTPESTAKLAEIAQTNVDQSKNQPNTAIPITEFGNYE